MYISVFRVRVVSRESLFRKSDLGQEYRSVKVDYWLRIYDKM